MRTTVEHAQLKNAIIAAEGKWNEADVADWERERERAWATWSLPGVPGL
jgi:hypothetical protein